MTLTPGTRAASSSDSVRANDVEIIAESMTPTDAPSERGSCWLPNSRSLVSCAISIGSTTSRTGGTVSGRCPLLPRATAKRHTPTESAIERCERSLTPNASFKRTTQVEDATVAGLGDQIIGRTVNWNEKTSGGNSARGSRGQLDGGSGLDELRSFDRLLQRNPLVGGDGEYLARHEDTAVHERTGDRVQRHGVLADDRLGARRLVRDQRPHRRVDLALQLRRRSAVVRRRIGRHEAHLLAHPELGDHPARH